MRILFLTARPPWPSRRGDQARVAGFVQELGKRHEISVLAQSSGGAKPAPFPEGVEGGGVPRPRSAALNSLWKLARLPAQVALYWDPHFAQAALAEIGRFKPDVVVVMLSRLGWLLPALNRVPVVLDLVDALTLNMRNGGKCLLITMETIALMTREN